MSNSRLSTDLILEKLTVDKMGKYARKTYRSEIEKCLDMLDVPGHSWNYRAKYLFRSSFGLFLQKVLWFPVNLSVIMSDMKGDVQYSPDSGMFVFGVKPSDFNFYSTTRLFFDDTVIISKALSGPLGLITKDFPHYQGDVLREKGHWSWGDLDNFDKNSYSEKFLDSYITDDMKRIIQVHYPTYFEYAYFVSSITHRGYLRKIDSRVNPSEVYSSISNAVYDYIKPRFLGLKIKDGFFKSVDTEDFLPIFAVDFDRDVLYSNYCFRKTSLEALRAKSVKGNYPRGAYIYSKIMSGGSFWVDYSGITLDFLWSDEFNTMSNS